MLVLNNVRAQTESYEVVILLKGQAIQLIASVILLLWVALKLVVPLTQIFAVTAVLGLQIWDYVRWLVPHPRHLLRLHRVHLPPSVIQLVVPTLTANRQILTGSVIQIVVDSLPTQVVALAQNQVLHRHHLHHQAQAPPQL